jgi:hypothetical protein
MPDETVPQLAKNNELWKPVVLTNQVHRMLADPKSDAFIDGFLDSWLNLRELGSAPPDRAKFKAYYQYDPPCARRPADSLDT